MYILAMETTGQMPRSAAAGSGAGQRTGTGDHRARRPFRTADLVRGEEPSQKSDAADPKTTDDMRR